MYAYANAKMKPIPQFAFEIQLTPIFSHFGNVWPHALEMIEQLCNFQGSMTTCKKKLSSSNHSLDEPDSLFGITSHIPRNASPQPLETSE